MSCDHLPGKLRLCVLVLLLLLEVTSALGQTTQDWRFRNEFVPATALPDQVQGLLPMKREEFERRLQQKETQTPPASSSRLEECNYRARFVNGRLVDGAASLRLVTTSERPRPFVLEPCNLAIESARWNDSAAHPVALGRDRNGNLLCLVPESGQLIFEWSLPPDRTSEFESSFVLRLPPALRRTLEIVTNHSASLTTNCGIVRQREAADSSAERHWIIDLSAEHEVRLTVTQASSDAAERRRTVAQEVSQYALRPSALDLQTFFALDVFEQPLVELRLLVDAPLELTGVRLGSQELKWRKTAADSRKQATVTCYLREPLSGFGQSLEIDATSNTGLPSGAQLPRITLADAILQDAKLILQSPQWMRLSPRATGQATKTSSGSSSDGAPQDRFEFLVYGERGGVEVASELIGLPLVERSATSITIEPNQVVGQFNAELTSRGGEFFAVEAQVPRHWVVDSVETQPPDMLADRSLAARVGGTQRLQLKLTEPVTTERALRLSIRAHYRRPANLRLAGQSGFTIATFPAAGRARQLVSLHVNDPQAELRFTGDDALVQLAPENVNSSDRDLFPDQAPGAVFDAQSAGEGLVVTLRPTAPRYRADVALSARVESNGIHQEASIVCNSEAAVVGSIALRISPAPSGRIRWRLAGDQDRELSALIETSGSGETVHRLLLPRSTTTPVTVQGSWIGQQSTPLNLIWAPEAADQTAIVEINSAVGRRAVHVKRARPLPGPSHAASSDLIPLGRFYYEGGQRAEIVVADDSLLAGNGVWIEKLHVKTYLSSQQITENIATLIAHNNGQTHVKLQLPETVGECRVQESVGELIVRRGANGEFEIPLPAGQSTVNLSVRYLSVGTTDRAWPIRVIRAPLPTMHVPVLSREWTVGFPPGYVACLPAVQPAEEPVAATSDDEAADGARLTGSGSLAGPLSSWLRAASGLNLASRFVLFYQPRGTPAADLPFRNWKLYTQVVTEGEIPQIGVFRSAEFILWAASILTLSAAAASWLRRHVTTLVAAAALCIAGSVLVPAPYSWLLVGAGSGVAVGLLWSLLQLPRRVPWLVSPHTSPLRKESAAALVSVVLLAGGLLAAPPVSDARLSRVIIPIDDERRAVGDYVYLEPGLYEALSTSPVAEVDSPTWFVEQSRYEIPLGSRHSGAAEGLSGINVVFDIHTLADDTLVELPLAKSHVSIVAGNSRLDGKRATLWWKGKGEALWLDVPQAGRHQLELTLAARVQQENNASVIEMTVPPAATSTVVCTGTATEINVVGGFAELVQSPGKHVFRLLNSGRLELHWKDGNANDNSSVPDQIVEQLSWWRIRSASMVLETQFKLASKVTPTDRIHIWVDPRLRLIPNFQSGPIARVESDSTEEQNLTVYLSEPAEEATVRLSWLWEDAFGMGTFLLPRVSVREADVRRDWLAISVDPNLKLANQITGYTPVPTADFARSWVSATNQPTVAFQHPAGERPPVIAIEPVVQLATGEHTAEWTVSAGKAQAQCTFQLTGVPANCFEHSFAVPTSLRVTEVVLLQSESAAAIRWWQQPDGRVRVSLLDSPQVAQEIRFRADMKIDGKVSRFTLPQVRMDTAEIAASKLRLYRQPDVHISVEAVAAWQAVADGDVGRLRPSWGRLVAVLQPAPDAPLADLVVQYQPNRPKVSGTMVIGAAPIESDWHCQLLLDVSTTGGVLDQLRFLVPEDWKNDLRIEPEMPFRFDPAANDDRWLLTVEPKEALTGRTVLKLTRPLPFSSGGIHVPEVQVLGIETLARQVFLASSSASQGFDWELNGLTPVSVNPDEPPISAFTDLQGTLYRVSAPRFRAVATYRQDQAGKSEVPLLENETLVRAAGRALTTSTLLVSPASNAPIRFELPANCRFVQALVDGLAVPCGKVGVRSWQLPPASAVLPYELKIIYEHAESRDGDARKFLDLASPRIIGLETPPALWSVRREGDSSDGDALPTLAGQSAEENVVELSRRHSELMRLEAYVSALEVANSARAGVVPKPVLAESFFRWEQRALKADRSLEGEADNRNDDAETQLRRRMALESMSAVRQRLFQAEVLTEELQLPVSAAGPSLLGRDSSLFFVPAGELSVRLPTTRSVVKPAAFRWSLAAIVLLGAILLTRAVDSLALREWMVTNRGFALIPFGVLWWMLAPLGWFGWLLVAMGAWLGLHQVRRLRMQPADSYDHAA